MTPTFLCTGESFFSSRIQYLLLQYRTPLVSNGSLCGQNHCFFPLRNGFQSVDRTIFPVKNGSLSMDMNSNYFPFRNGPLCGPNHFFPLKERVSSADRTVFFPQRKVRSVDRTILFPKDTVHSVWTEPFYSIKERFSSCGQNHSFLLKVHKRENFLGSDFDSCTFSQLVMHKC